MKKILIGSIIVIALAIVPTGASAEEYSLDDLYTIALQHSEKIKVSEENLYISKLGKEKAFSVLIPRLSGFGNYTKYSEDKSAGFGVIQPDKATAWGMKLEQSFSLSGRELTGLKMAEENIVRNSYDLYAAREETLTSSAETPQRAPLLLITEEFGRSR
jgi:outer membrane protein TolC